MGAIMITQSRAPQFLGVVGFAFLLILVIFFVTFGIRRFFPRRSAARDSERGLSGNPGEGAPLLSEVIPGPVGADEYHQSTSYGATALEPSPADKREFLHQYDEAGNADDQEEGSGRGQVMAEIETTGARPGSDEANSSASSDDDRTPVGPFASAGASSDGPIDYLGGAEEEWRQPSRPYSPTTTASSTHSRA